MLIPDMLLLTLSIILFGISGSLVVKSLIKINSYFRFREFVIGLLLIGISTSLPELSIGIISSLNKVSALSFGNILGSNIVDLTLVIGIVAVLGNGVKIEKEINRKTFFIIITLVLLPVALFLDHELSRLDGLFLITAFILYVATLVERQSNFKAAKHKKTTKKELYKNIAIFIISLIILIVSAEIIVNVASNLALEFSVPPILIGIMLLSAGTTLPEIFFETLSVKEGHSSMAVGDLLGSLVFNSTLILGIVAVISPIKAQFSSFIANSLFIILALMSFSIVSRTGNKISRREGMFLLLLYVLFLITNIVPK